MNLASSPAAFHAEPPGSIPTGALEEACGNADPAETWLLAITGISSATFMANLICQPPHPHAAWPSIYWILIFLQAALLLALTVAAGAAGIFAPWFFIKTKPPFPFSTLAKKVGLGWAFLPSIILLYRRESPWMFLVLTITAVAIAFNIRRLVPAAEFFKTEVVPQTSDLPSLNGLPGSDSRPLRSFFLALCLQGALIAAIAEYFFLAAILLSIFLFLLVWRWSSFDSTTTNTFANKRSSILLYTLAFFLTAFMLIPPVSGAGGAFRAGRAPRTPPTFAHGPTAISSSDYIGIVLWPPPAKKQVLPPVPHPNSFATGGAAKPFIIPFDGQYWYFKAPYIKPGPHAHIARGKPTDVTVSSSDLAPLLMEAHQILDRSIDLACCREIEVSITNADTRPGKISLGLVLTDSISVDKPSHNLGSRPVLSSEPLTIPLNREPTEEILRFPIPRSSTTHRFNEITIVYLPAPERARGGAKISIQSFTLTPR